MSTRWNERYELFGAWCAPIFTVLTVIGFLGLSRFYDPASANPAPADLARSPRRFRGRATASGWRR